MVVEIHLCRHAGINIDMYIWIIGLNGSCTTLQRNSFRCLVNMRISGTYLREQDNCMLRKSLNYPLCMYQCKKYLFKRLQKC